ncbi:MAG: cyclic pyranopterin monophosphate synthase MoaC [Nitrosomonadales bacterium]|jgi:cyclic pyranopterin phosphate synthase
MLTHIDKNGNAKMVDVSDKKSSFREASATGKIYITNEILEIISTGKNKKGDVLTIAQIAGIQAAKSTSNAIPLCHNINISSASINFEINDSQKFIQATSFIKTQGNTGVEMEAIYSVTTALITIYDMCKAVTHQMQISEIELVSKKGGKRDFIKSD